MNQRTEKAAGSKPAKPYADFPLFAHATRRWAKKIRGKLHYFGPWDDPTRALQHYVEQRDDLYAGMKPRAKTDGLAVRDLLNRFLTAKRHLADADEITPRTFAEYHSTCKRIGEHLGLDRLVDDLASVDFEQFRAALAKNWGPVTLGNEIQKIRVVFKYAFDAGLIEKPIRYGPTFKRPNRKTLRQARHSKGPRMFEAEQVRKILSAAGIQLRAMILLGINCGFGNHDIATLTTDALNLTTKWINFPRPKTGINRRCPLWRETVDAIRAAIVHRPNPRNLVDADTIFITVRGAKWGTTKLIDDENGALTLRTDDPVSKETTKLLKSLGMHRAGLGFYALRHTFETIAGETTDQVAVNAIMGHAPAANDMASVYRERISDERLKAVTDYVHDWLFKPKKIEKRSGSRAAVKSKKGAARKKPTAARR